VLEFNNYEELKQVFREQEQEQNESDQTRRELEQTRLNLAKLKEEEQRLKNAKLRQSQETQQAPKNSNKLYYFTIAAMIIGTLVPFVAAIIVLIKF